MNLSDMAKTLGISEAAIINATKKKTKSIRMSIDETLAKRITKTIKQNLVSVVESEIRRLTDAPEIATETSEIIVPEIVPEDDEEEDEEPVKPAKRYAKVEDEEDDRPVKKERAAWRDEIEEYEPVIKRRHVDVDDEEEEIED